MESLDHEKIGHFISEMRKAKNMTQKELGDQLFVSDKTISKWENGISMPNIVLLAPLAELLDISVNELLKGEKLTQESVAETREEALVNCSVDIAMEGTLRWHKRNRRYAFFIVAVVFGLEAFWLWGLDIRDTYVKDTLYLSVLMLLFAFWFCFFAKDFLPSYYDNNKINYVSQGIFKIHIVGLSLNNHNWRYICIVCRVFTLSFAVLYPLLCIGICWYSEVLWREFWLPVVIVGLSIFMIVLYTVGKRYEV